MFHGREVRTHIKNLLRVKTDFSDETYDEHAKRVASALQDAWALARMHNREYAEAAKRYHDKRTKEVLFREGQKVKYRTPGSKFKLDPKISKGPYTITRKMTNGNAYYIKDEATGKERCVNAKHLAPAFGRIWREGGEASTPA